MPLSDQFGKILQKKGEEQQPDVHAVDISIGRDDHPVVTEVFQSVLDGKCVLEQVELLILVDDLAGESKAVEGFAF